ncbi:MAG: hypothetical protein E7655_08630 [Ruminococcaceae bacterium]|nr:hypothetical protein [Oscillospiraceae bacterium]
MFIKAALIATMLFCVFTIVRQQFEFNRLKVEREALEAQIDAYELRLEKLEEEYAQPFDKEYIVKVAREKLNYRLPEEIIFYNDLAK